MRIFSALVTAAAVILMSSSIMAQDVPQASSAPVAPSASALGTPDLKILNPGAATLDGAGASDDVVSPAAAKTPLALNVDEASDAPAQAMVRDQDDAPESSEVAASEEKESSPPASDSVSAEAEDSKRPPAEPTLNIEIDLTNQKLHVTENGSRLYTWRISSGRYGHETPTGTFQPTWMAKMWYSRQYDNSPMPHSIFFHRGVAIHGTYYTSQLGRPASAGCVRLAPKNAASLYKLVSRHGKDRTRIVVRGKAKTSPPAVASRQAPRYAERDDSVYYAPSYYGRRSAYRYSDPYYAPVRKKRRGTAYQTPPREYYARRGLFNSYGVYGF